MEKILYKYNMVRVSKREIKQDVLERLFFLFYFIIKKAKTKEDFKQIIEEIFTEAECVMLVKRIGLFYLLLKEANWESICEILHISTSTIATYTIFLKEKTKIQNTLKTLKQREEFVGKMEDVLSDLLIQPGIKIGHYSLKRAHELQKEKRKNLGQ